MLLGYLQKLLRARPATRSQNYPNKHFIAQVCASFAPRHGCINIVPRDANLGWPGWQSRGSLAFPRNRKINFHVEAEPRCAKYDVLQKFSRASERFCAVFSPAASTIHAFTALVTSSACCVTRRPLRIRRVLNSSL